jgi:hypothetical protein
MERYQWGKSYEYKSGTDLGDEVARPGVWTHKGARPPKFI